MAPVVGPRAPASSLVAAKVWPDLVKSRTTRPIRGCAVCPAETRAEGEGFEPSTDGTAGNGFRDRRIRPLCHPSARATAYRASVKGFIYDSRARRSGRVAEG